MNNDVMCIGSAAVDSVFLLKEFPSPDEISLAYWCKQFCGGSSANVAVGLSRLGLYTGLVSKVGRDPEGVHLLNRLISEGVDIRTVIISGKTAKTVVLLTEKGEKAIIADTDCVLKTEEELPQASISKSKALYIGDCFLPVAEKAVDTAREMDIKSFLRVRNVHFSFDLNVEDVISNADFVIMNERTYSMIDKRNENFIITKGKKGCYYVKEDVTVEGFPVESVDTTGAGDAFCAGFIYKILRGGSVKEALHFGNAAGAVSTTKYGAMDSMPSKREIESLL
ncbi:MAG: carbohydrate kinase family protein [Theionarchaea archaeon]|nr:MAG: hypothetical protein AYK19_10000 [Theionarchaea archaeon DG-70-1]MBU7027458.1 carbohydrate kinase family protein [Theionarchaea archaeon]